jgi:predicted secreted protein
MTEIYANIRLSAGTYYWTVRATDSSGNRQIPFEYSRVNNIYYHGVKTLTVE